MSSIFALMKGIFILLLLLPHLSPSQAPAIQQVAKEVSETDLRANLYKLASPEMEGRLAGSNGDSLASAYIADWFKKQGLLAPYKKNTSYFQSVPMQQVILTKSELNTPAKKYRQFDDWYIFQGNTYKSIDLESLPVAFAGYGIVSGEYNDLLGLDVQGKAVIILQVQPADKISDLLFSSEKSSISADYMKNLADKGAAAVIVATPDFDRSSRTLKTAGLLRSYRNPENLLNPLPRIYASDKMINELLSQNDVTIQSLIINLRRNKRPLSFQTKATIGIDVQLDSIKQYAPNVIGMIRGTDTAAASVILMAHHDHLGKIGGKIFNGAADNASGTAALMEIAKLVQKAIKNGQRPKRSIIFASFTGQELGLLGSFYYAQNPVYPPGHTWAAYNLEIMGTVDEFYNGKIGDSNYTYFSVADSLKHGLEAALFNAGDSVELELNNRYQQPAAAIRWLSGSDAYPFFLQDVAVIQTGSGFSRTYHQPTDNADKINFPLLILQTKLSFLTLWNIASN